MHLSKTILKAKDTPGQIVDYVPREFRGSMPASARSFMDSEAVRNSSFHLSPLVAEQTGLAEVARQTLEERIEGMALEKVNVIQEEAFKQAYDLGLTEGRDRAFSETTAEIKLHLTRLDQICASLEVLKKGLLMQNEAHIVRTVLELTKRLTYAEVGDRKDRILPVLREAIDTAQTDENVIVRLSPEDYDYLTTLKERAEKEFEFIKKLKLEKSPEISVGGCIVDTNYGRVDATIEERIGKLWDVVTEKIPKPETPQDEK